MGKVLSNSFFSTLCFYFNIWIPNQKLCQLLDDETTYSKLTSYPTERVNKNFNTNVKSLLRKNPVLLKSFLIINPSLPYMYGLVKTHKPEKPLRPIISSVGSVTYKLSK